MTISYNLDVSSSSSWTFLKVIFRWRGSIWKSVFQELIFWTICYFIVCAIYRYALNEYHQLQFAGLSQFLYERDEHIPLTFLLGFFVTIIFDRWKNIFANIGFVDNAAFFVANFIIGKDEETRIVKRNIVRYLCLTQVLVLRDISIKVRKRFPNLDAVVDAGFMLPHEMEHIESIKNNYAKYWVPMNWAFALSNEMRLKGKIIGDVLLNGLFNEIRAFHQNLQTLRNTDWVPVPLAYPQVVFCAVRVYFLMSIVSRQYIINKGAANETPLDLYIPFMSMFQFVFYMGWLKVAEALLNPLGEDDDDFECNFIIDRNITISLAMVDQTSSEINQDFPEQMKDAFFSGERPLCSVEDANITVNALIGSAVLQEVGKENVKKISRTRTTVENPQKYANGKGGISRRISERFFTKRRSKSLGIPNLENGNVHNNHPPAWYNNNQFASSTSSQDACDNNYLETLPEEGSSNNQNQHQNQRKF